MASQLERLAAWIRSHDHHAHVAGDQVVIGIATVDRDGVWHSWVQRVSTLSAARDALGY